MNKSQVIAKLTKVREEIISLASQIPEKHWHDRFLGKWTLLDFVAHLIGWDFWGVRATREIVKGKLPAYYSYYDGKWAKFNALLVNKYKQLTKSASLAKARQSRLKLLKLLEKVPEADFNRDFGIRYHNDNITVTSDTLYQADDEFTHLKQLKRWLETGKPQ